jgi:hypothetical protein
MEPIQIGLLAIVPPLLFALVRWLRQPYKVSHPHFVVGTTTDKLGLRRRVLIVIHGRSTVEIVLPAREAVELGKMLALIGKEADAADHDLTLPTSTNGER